MKFHTRVFVLLVVALGATLAPAQDADKSAGKKTDAAAKGATEAANPTLASQNPGKVKADPAADGSEVNGPPFVASLLTIKADWSQLPKAKEIEIDLRQALRGEAVSDELLQALPGSGPTILFPMETVSYYSAEHYAQFLAWLKSLGIAIEREEFEPRTNAMRSRVSAGEGKPLEEIIYPVETAKLIKDLPYLGLSVNSPGGAQPFITRTGHLSWHVQNHQSSGLIIQRTLQVRESSRGEAEPKIDNAESCGIIQPTLKDGQVLIIPAFPSNSDGTYRSAARQKGIELLLVIEQRPPGPAPAAEARLVLPDRVERIEVKTTRPRTSGGGFFGGGMGSVLSINSTSQQPPARMVIGGDIMISWSEEKDVAWGFSKSLGKWARQELNSAATGPRDVPVVGNNLAVWWVGSRYYGYSGEVGRWDVLSLPEGHSPPPIVDDDFARVHDGDDIYTFAASTGRWSSPQGKESAIEPPAAGDAERVKVFSLRNARAEDIGKLVWQLYSGEGLSVVADQRTNSLIARGPDELLNIVQALLTRLDEELAPTDKPRTTTPETSDAAVAEQTKQYEVKEQQAAALAQQLQGARQLNAAEKKRLEGDLRRAVADSFAARQKLHEAELAHLSQRLRGLEQTIAARQKIADQIIDRRVEDLLSPNLQWDQSGALAPQVDSTAKRSSTPASPSPPLPLSPSAASPRITVGPYVPPEIEEIWKVLGIKVRQLTFEESKEKDKPRGAFIVTEIYLDLPNQQLRVGDIIISVQVRGDSRGSRIAELQILRGDDTFPRNTFPLNVEFSSASPQTTKGGNPRTPRNVANGLIPGESEHLWRALGIEVRPVRPDQESESIPRGSFIIVMIMTDNQQQGLRVGDVITSVQSEAQYGGTRKATLQIRRGKETFPVTTEYAWRPAPPVSAADAPADTIEALRALEPARLAGTVNPKADQVLWNILGVKADTVARKALPNSPFDMGLLVSEVRPNSPGRELRPGDIIVGLHEWSTPMKAHLAWAILQPLDKNLRIPNPTSRTTAVETNLYFLRDDEPRSIRVVLPASPPEGTSASETSSPTDLTSARAYRDKLRERWDALEALYEGGRVSSDDVVQAANDLGPAEAAAAATTDERRKALQEHVERVKRIKTIVEDKYKQNVEPVQNLRAAEAALIKAEAQLAAANQAGDEASPNAAAGPPSLNLPLPTDSQSLILRTADDFEQRLRDAEKAVADIKRRLDVTSNPVMKARLQKDIDEQLRAPERRLKFIREEYAAQIRFLELELHDAESAVETTGKEYEAQKSLFDKGIRTGSEAREAQRAYEAARLRLEKAKTLLGLYLKADPKPAPAEPPADTAPKAPKADPA